eukprot:scaffold11241_cov67-Skeletonema_dohrnii-CCMP3373.AAC.1
MLIAPFTAVDTIWCSRVVLKAISNWASSGHLRRYKAWQIRRNEHKQQNISFHAIVTNHN